MADTTLVGTVAGPYYAPQFGAVYSAWATNLIGVYVYLDASQNLVYATTTDGGTTISAPTTIKASVDGWGGFFDGNQPALITDTLHLVYSDNTNGVLHYRKLDVSAGSLDTERTVVSNASIIAATDAEVFVTVARDGGHIVCGYYNAFTPLDLAYESVDSINFTSMTSCHDGETLTDEDQVLGIVCNTGDAADVAVLYYDQSATAVTIKVWDDSGNAWVETAVASSITLTTITNGAYNFMSWGARDDGHILVAIWNNTDDVGADLRVFDIYIDNPSTPDVTEVTNVVSNSAESGAVSVIVDRLNDEVYVGYITGASWGGAAQQVWYKKSADWGTTWGAAVQYTESGARYIVLGATSGSPTMGRMQFVAYVVTADDLILNLVNDVSWGAADPTVVLTGTMVPSVFESAVAAGGRTIIATVTGGTWHADLDNDDTESEDFIAGLVSAGVEVLGWNNVVVGKFYRKEVLADSPLNYLRLGGNVTDQGSAAANGTPTALTVGPALLLSSAQVSSVFNAPTAKVALSSPAALDNLWDAGGTAEIVLRPWASGYSLDQSKLFSKIDGGAGWELIIDNQNGGFVDVSLRVDFSTQQGVWKVAGKIPVGYQTHLAVTFNADSASNDPVFYINGQVHVPVEETTPSGSRSSDASSNLFIGSNSSVALTFNGELQESALYGSSLSATRVQAHVLAASNSYGLRYSDLARTSATVATLTLPAFPFYDITVAEIVTATFPITVFASAPSVPIVATPTFTINPDSRKTGFTPPLNPFATGQQTTGPFGNVNGGLGPAAGAAFRILGAGDQWQIGIPQLSVGLAGTTNPRVLLMRATEIAEVNE